jgi:aspartyl-tRNA(Asn)/glutamyl-tRNA(Gln) amidotransferase subunit A
MASGRLASKTIHELRELLAAGQAPAELLDDVLNRIDAFNGQVRAYLSVPDRRRLHEELKRQWEAAPHGRLRGIPITIKDNICIAGEEVTCASRILAGFRSPYDATVIERLRREGAVLIPRANMDEFAFGSSTENSAFGGTRNPRAREDDPRVPGGSSGGSAAAVAADLAIAALGSDTGGSIRQPAAFCGIVGLKPTYGRVSRYGLVAFASSLDQIGPLTKDVRDAAILLSVIAGHDPRDSTSAPGQAPDYEARLELPKGVRIGVPSLSGSEGLEESVREAIARALRTLGLPTVPIELPHIDKAIATYYIVATAEASSNLARYDGVQYGMRAAGNGSLVDMYLDTRTQGFGAEAKRRILLGTYVLSQGYYDAYYLKGMKVRTLIKRDFDDAFTHCSVIAMPTSPTAAFKPGEKLTDPLQMYLSDVFTISANLAGMPAISICCGTGPDGLPIGFQLLAPPFKEDLLLQAAHHYEQQANWPSQRASLRTLT